MSGLLHIQKRLLPDLEQLFEAFKAILQCFFSLHPGDYCIHKAFFSFSEILESQSESVSGKILKDNLNNQCNYLISPNVLCSNTPFHVFICSCFYFVCCCPGRPPHHLLLIFVPFAGSISSLPFLWKYILFSRQS